MNMHRRDVILAGLSLLTGAHAFVPRRVQSQAQDPAARLLRALQANRMPLTMTGRPAGPGWDWLVQQARDATFTLIGEQAGVAESAQLAAALFGIPLFHEIAVRIMIRPMALALESAGDGIVPERFLAETQLSEPRKLSA